MPCIARKADGTVDRAVCESISLHPLKNKRICNAEKTVCDSPYRICRICVGQRLRVLGCYRKDWKTVQSVDLEDLRVVSAISGLCQGHHMQYQVKDKFSDRFPIKEIQKVLPTPTAAPKRRRGRKPRLVELPEEEVIRDVCDELGGELPDVDFDPDEDMGMEPGVEFPHPAPVPAKNALPVHSPAYQRAAARSRGEEARPLPKLAGPPRAKPVAIPLAPPSRPAPAPFPQPVPRLSAQRNPKLEELDNLRAFLAQPSSGGGVIVEGDDE